MGSHPHAARPRASLINAAHAPSPEPAGGLDAYVPIRAASWKSFTKTMVDPPRTGADRGQSADISSACRDGGSTTVCGSASMVVDPPPKRPVDGATCGSRRDSFWATPSMRLSRSRARHSSPGEPTLPNGCPDDHAKASVGGPADIRVARPAPGTATVDGPMIATGLLGPGRAQQIVVAIRALRSQGWVGLCLCLPNPSPG